MKKQLLPILMILFTSMVGYSQMVGDTFIDSFITYEITSLTPNVVEIINYNPNGGTDVVIPNTVTPASAGKTLMTTYTVTNIDVNAFRSKGLTSAIIGDNVISIANEAFADNSLTSVSLGVSVQTIGFRAFGNNQLTNIELPDSVTFIDWRVFETNSISTVTIPVNVTSIGLGAFRNNPLSCIVSRPTTAPSITTGSNNDSFNIDRSTIDLTIPTGTGSSYTSAQWTGFNSIIESDFGATFIADDITYLITGSPNNEVIATNYDPTGGTVVNIPATVINTCVSYTVVGIGNNAFSSNNLTSVTIPNSITTINFAAFANNNLTSVTIPDSVTELGQDAFNNNQLTNVVLSNNLVSIGQTAFAFNDLSTVTIPDSVTTLNNGAFVQNNNMTTVTIGSGLTSIGDFAFRFNNLNNVVIPDNIIHIGNLAFEQNNIFNLNLGNGVQTIGDNAFSFNIIEHVVIPDSVISIGDNAFYTNSNARASITLGNSLTTIGAGAFISGSSAPLNSVTIPASVTSIGDTAFQIPTLTDVFCEGTTPAIITTGGNADTFAVDRSTIHLHIPSGTMGVYVTDSGALWTGFNPITEGGTLSISEFGLANDIEIITSTEGIQIIADNDIRLQDYTIYALSGAKISVGNELNIDTASLTTGVYILKLDFDKGTMVKKIVIH
ncbi:leucine-rich repeat domain-containing protein [Aquimarina sp. SS2-1]|uniref:leucine-rich repeat domain-containing protein n=1 Tax=Aquimarina besae TaxID=3342247 RepID=UPI00366CEAEF